MTDIRRAQTWECNETRADAEDVPPAHDTVDLWPDYPRFSAVVDEVVDDAVAMTVATSNSHPRAPELGERVDIHVEKLLEQPRWSLKSEARSSEREQTPVVADGGHPVERKGVQYQCESERCGRANGGISIRSSTDFDQKQEQNE